MRVVVLTCGRHGVASSVIPFLHFSKKISIVKVVLVQEVKPIVIKKIKRNLKKVLKIGFLGALNGLRIRKWFEDKNTLDIISLCKSLYIPIQTVSSINSNDTKRAFEESNAELGLSLGNGYIAKKIYTIPKLGMINIHTEVLPKYKGAHSIIWPIHDGSEEMGFTIHQINDVIDGGTIIYQEVCPIKFYPSLRQTVENNMKVIYEKVPAAFLYTCENYYELIKVERKQEPSKSYTTPTFRQFLQMVNNNKKLYRLNRYTKNC